MNKSLNIPFDDDYIVRYSRHILLKEIGVEGQQLISQAKVLIVGAGGLGSPLCLYLAAAGVGTIGIIDGDKVDLSNLQRQVVHFTKDIGNPKAQSAKEKMSMINPKAEIVAYDEFLSPDNALNIIADYDFVADATDSFASKYLINDACIMAKKPFSIGAILRFQGHTLTHLPGTACYRCVFPEPPSPNDSPTCSQAGVMGAVAGMVGTIQAAETLKYITGAGHLLTNQLLFFDSLTMDFRKVKVNADPKCPVCGEMPTITKLETYKTPDCQVRS